MKKLAAALIFLCGAKSAFAQTVKVDFAFDTTQKNPYANHLLITSDKKKTSDTFDAISGASLNFSTKILSSSSLPKSLACLFLFAVSPSKTAERDALSVEKSEDGLIDVTFIHRGVVYWLQADEKGNIDLENGLSLAVVGEKKDGAFALKDDFVLSGKDATDMKNADFDKIDFEDDKAKTPDGKTLKKAKATMTFENGILSVRALFKWQDEKKKE